MSRWLQEVDKEDCSDTDDVDMHSPAYVGAEADAQTEVWNLIMNDETIQIILKWTNVKLGRKRATKNNANVTHTCDLEMTELNAFICLLFYSAVLKSNHESTRALSGTDGSCRDIFWMSRLSV
ncbi:hypothetical protein PR048_011131 [Dryococelus australis]|uniref:PiggyBac transposable element-derived protein domain-containing protein n=1 Tax=Dryococelus australis TaxID=614101 RepID=A0ABQ9HL85_9NEOP|nr:hypothetical protein PR048_011131 [Dryococelus australis]